MSTETSDKHEKKTTTHCSGKTSQCIYKNTHTHTLFWKDLVVHIQKHTNGFLEIRQESERIVSRASQHCCQVPSQQYQQVAD